MSAGAPVVRPQEAGQPLRQGFEVNLFTDTEIAKAEWGLRDSKGLGEHNHWAFTTGPPDADSARVEIDHATTHDEILYL